MAQSAACLVARVLLDGGYDDHVQRLRATDLLSAAEAHGVAFAAML